MRKVASWILLAIGLLPWWLIFVWFFGYRGPGQLILVTFIYCLSVAALALVARRVTAWGWLVVGLLILAGLFVPTALLTDNLGNSPSLSRAIFQITVFLLPSIALIMAAALLYSGLNLLTGSRNPAVAGGAEVQATQSNPGSPAAASFDMRWLVAGLLLLVGLLVLIAVLAKFFGSSSGLLEFLSKSTILLLLLIALIVAAVLLFSGRKSNPLQVNTAQAGSAGSPATQNNQPRLAAACFGLSGLLWLKTLHNLYWVTAWDATTDSLGYIWIVIPVLATVFSGVLLLINLRGRTAWAGLGYLLLVPGMIIAVSTFAQRVDFRQMTEARAGQVSQRVEAFYAREGRYPQDLRQVRPWFAASLPGPFIMYGQDWCYEAGEEYYQLGYVDREHWSSPELIRRVYKIGGAPSDPEGICGEEIEALIRNEPFFHEK